MLETVYKVSLDKITHIHGSLQVRDGEPISGHGNKERIDKIQDNRKKAELLYDEKRSSFRREVEDYYKQIYKVYMST